MQTVQEVIQIEETTLRANHKKTEALLIHV